MAPPGGEAQGPAIRLLNERSAFVRALEEGSESSAPGRSVPMLDSPATRRLIALLERRGLLERDGRLAASGATSPPAWHPDDVLVATSDPLSRGVARYLSALSGRRAVFIKHPEDAFSVGSSCSRTLVAPLSSMNSSFTHSLSEQDTPTGVFTSRTEAGLSALLIKGVLARSLMSKGTALLSNSVDPSDSQKEVRPSVSEARAAAEDGAGALVFAGHGRECAVHLQDGVVCGRDVDWSNGPTSIPETCWAGIPACQQGDGCFRRGIDDSKRVAASLFDCVVAIVNSCMSFKLAESQFTPEVSLALSFVEGYATAAFGTPWVGTDGWHVGPLAAWCIEGGASLGECLKFLNGSIRESRSEIGLFCLLGDAGLVLEPDKQWEKLSLPLDGGTIEELRRCSLVSFPEPVDASRLTVDRGDVAVVRVAASTFVVHSESPEGSLRIGVLPTDPEALCRERGMRSIENLRILDSLGIISRRAQIGRLETRLRSCARAVGDSIPDVSHQVERVRMIESLIDQIRDVEREIAADLIERTDAAFNLHRYYVGSSRIVEIEEVQCMFCTRTAYTYHLRHRVFAAAHRSLTVCVHCAETLEQSTQSPLHLSVHGPHRVRRGTGFDQLLTLENRSSLPLSATVAYCSFQETTNGAALRQMVDVDLAPLKQQRLRFAGAMTAKATLDEHRIRFYVVAAGDIAALAKNVWVFDD